MRIRRGLLLAGLAAGLVVAGTAVAAPRAFVATLRHHSVVASTVPGNGDVNPYGVAVVRRTTGRLIAGDVLVSNFNAGSNLQGTGTTIVQISPGGARTVFARIDAMTCPAAVRAASG